MLRLDQEHRVCRVHTVTVKESEICVGIEWNLSGNFTTVLFCIINNLTQYTFFNLREDMKLKLKCY